MFCSDERAKVIDPMWGEGAPDAVLKMCCVHATGANSRAGTGPGICVHLRERSTAVPTEEHYCVVRSRFSRNAYCIDLRHGHTDTFSKQLCASIPTRRGSNAEPKDS